VFSRAGGEIEYVADALARRCRRRTACHGRDHADDHAGAALDLCAEAARCHRGNCAVQFVISAFDEENRLCNGDKQYFHPETLRGGAGFRRAVRGYFQEAGLPAGVLNVVSGVPAEVGDLLVADPRVKMITFTGSTRTGRHLAVEAAKHLKKFTLEMGGKRAR
jgi:Aldehyde dehydrogenase family